MSHIMSKMAKSKMAASVYKNEHIYEKNATTYDKDINNMVSGMRNLIKFIKTKFMQM